MHQLQGRIRPYPPLKRVLREKNSGEFCRGTALMSLCLLCFCHSVPALKTLFSDNSASFKLQGVLDTASYPVHDLTTSSGIGRRVVRVQSFAHATMQEVIRTEYVPELLVDKRLVYIKFHCHSFPLHFETHAFMELSYCTSFCCLNCFSNHHLCIYF